MCVCVPCVGTAVILEALGRKKGETAELRAALQVRACMCALCAAANTTLPLCVVAPKCILVVKTTHVPHVNFQQAALDERGSEARRLIAEYEKARKAAARAAAGGGAADADEKVRICTHSCTADSLQHGLCCGSLFVCRCGLQLAHPCNLAPRHKVYTPYHARGNASRAKRRRFLAPRSA